MDRRVLGSRQKTEPRPSSREYMPASGVGILYDLSRCDTIRGMSWTARWTDALRRRRCVGRVCLSSNRGDTKNMNSFFLCHYGAYITSDQESWTVASGTWLRKVDGLDRLLFLKLHFE